MPIARHVRERKNADDVAARLQSVLPAPGSPGPVTEAPARRSRLSDLAVVGAPLTWTDIVPGWSGPGAERSGDTEDDGARPGSGGPAPPETESVDSGYRLGSPWATAPGTPLPARAFHDLPAVPAASSVPAPGHIRPVPVPSWQLAGAWPPDVELPDLPPESDEPDAPGRTDQPAPPDLSFSALPAGAAAGQPGSPRGFEMDDLPRSPGCPRPLPAPDWGPDDERAAPAGYAGAGAGAGSGAGSAERADFDVRDDWPAAARWQPGEDDLPPGGERDKLTAAGAFGVGEKGRFGVRAFDPGRRGARVLAIVAIVAVVVAAFFAWRARPRVDAVVPPPAFADGAPGLSSGGDSGAGADGGSGTTAADGSGGRTRPVAGGGRTSGTEVVVAVEGKVRKPGVVRLPPGSRVTDALDAAGGAQPGVDVAMLNLARKVQDGELILVGVSPAPGITTGPPAAAGGGGAPGGLVNLNTATLADLDTLPGVGPVLAQRILDARTAQGSFGSVSDLRKVDGIGDARFEQLKDLVTT